MAEHGLLKATIATVIGGVIVAIVGSFLNWDTHDDPSRAWDHVQYTCDTEVLQNYINQYGANSTYATLAQRRKDMIFGNQPENNPCYVAPSCELLFQDQCQQRSDCFWNFEATQCTRSG